MAHTDDHVLVIDVGDLEKAAFVDAQGRRVERGDNGPMLEIAGAVQNAGDVIGADDVRESDLLFGYGISSSNQRCFRVLTYRNFRAPRFTCIVLELT